MKKSIVILLALVLVFSVGTVTGASSGWVEEDLVTDAKSKVNEKISTKTDTLIDNLQTEVTTKVEGQLTAVVDAQSTRANNELKKYYDDKVNAITMSPEVNDISQQVVINTSNFIKSEKVKIDEAVTNFLK